jgi:hypothetical protein
LGVAGIVGAGISGASSIAAGSEQAGAAKSAAQLQAQEAQNSLNFQEQQYNTEQQQAAPFLATGTQATQTLQQLLNGNQGATTNASIGGANYNLQTGGGSTGLLTPWTSQFQAPTAAAAEATPGYQFTQQQGVNALENSAAASGGALNTGTQKNLIGYSEGLADTTYQQTYQNALTQYQQAYNQFQNNQTNTYSRLAGVSGAGQQQVASSGQLGQQAANTVGNINLTTGAQQGQDIQNAGAATASGYVGAGNAASAGLSNVAGALTLQQLLGGGGAGSGVTASTAYNTGASAVADDPAAYIG